MSWMEKSKNYYLCRVCWRVLRQSRYVVLEHCGQLPKHLTDVEARSLVEGRDKKVRFSSVVKRRGAADLQTAEWRARYLEMVREKKRV